MKGGWSRQAWILLLRVLTAKVSIRPSVRALPPGQASPGDVWQEPSKAFAPLGPWIQGSSTHDRRGSSASSSGLESSPRWRRVIASFVTTVLLAVLGGAIGWAITGLAPLDSPEVSPRARREPVAAITVRPRLLAPSPSRPTACAPAVRAVEQDAPFLRTLTDQLQSRSVQWTEALRVATRLLDEMKMEPTRIRLRAVDVFTGHRASPRMTVEGLLDPADAAVGSVRRIATLSVHRCSDAWLETPRGRQLRRTIEVSWP